MAYGLKKILNLVKKIITAKRPEKFNLMEVTIFHLDEKYVLKEKIISEKVNIKTNEWILKNVSSFKFENGIFEENKFDIYKIDSVYNYEKINSLFNNLDTMLLLTLILNYNELLNIGYNNRFLDESLHKCFLYLFLFLMTGIAAILGMHTLKKSDNLKHIVIGLIVTVFFYYFKDLSIALGKTDRIPLFCLYGRDYRTKFFYFYRGLANK